MPGVFWLLSAISLVVLGLMVVGIRAAVRAYEAELERPNEQLEAFLNMLANIRQMLANRKRRA
jgi:hypothetical protein